LVLRTVEVVEGEDWRAREDVEEVQEESEVTEIGGSAGWEGAGAPWPSK